MAKMKEMLYKLQETQVEESDRAWDMLYNGEQPVTQRDFLDRHEYHAWLKYCEDRMRSEKR